MEKKLIFLVTKLISFAKSVQFLLFIRTLNGSGSIFAYPMQTREVLREKNLTTILFCSYFSYEKTENCQHELYLALCQKMNLVFLFLLSLKRGD